MYTGKSVYKLSSDSFWLLFVNPLEKYCEI